MRPTTASALIAALLVAGCGDSLPILCGGAQCPTERIVKDTFQSSVTSQLDVLVVIDDTSAMQFVRSETGEDTTLTAGALS